MTKIDELERILLYVFSQNCEKGFQNARRRFGIQIKIFIPLRISRAKRRIF